MTALMFFIEVDEVEHTHVAITSVSNKISHSVEVVDDEIIVARYFVTITHSISFPDDMAHSHNLYPIALYVYNLLKRHK